jgi:hypothetical protein
MSLILKGMAGRIENTGAGLMMALKKGVASYSGGEVFGITS